MIHKLKSGYIGTYDPERYKRTRRHGVYEHVYVYEQYNKCCILPWGQIHHINGKRDDNRPENLRGMMESDHMKLHLIGNKRAKKDMIGRKCELCGETTTYVKRNGCHQWFKNPFGKGFINRRCHDELRKAKRREQYKLRKSKKR